jgi:hypothetical protein
MQDYLTCDDKEKQEEVEEEHIESKVSFFLMLEAAKNTSSSSVWRTSY